MPDMVTSARNDRLRRVRRLAESRKARREAGLWVVEGVRLAEEVAAGDRPARLWVVETGAVGRDERLAAVVDRLRARGDDVLWVGRGLLREVADTRSPQGIVGVVDAPAWTPADAVAGPGPVVILDRVQDPGNLGTIARTAEAAGAAGLLLAPGSVDPGNPKAVRASAGSLLRLPATTSADPVAAVRRSGRRVWATAGRGGTSCFAADLAAPFGLVLGQEGQGVGPALAARADGRLTVPMAGPVESLNVAATAAVILFEAARQRVAGG